MTRWIDKNQWTGEWDGSWYVESLAGQTMAFENKSGAALSGVKALFYFSDFIESYGCAGITLYTTDALALGIVAAEVFGQDVGREQYVAHLDDW